MMTEYVRRHDIDIVLIHEITIMGLLNISGCDVYNNIGTQMRRTAVVSRKDITLTNINKPPTGRAIAVEYKGLYIGNIYDLSETARRMERE